MRMLEALRPQLDLIAMQDERSHQFVEQLIIDMEQGRDFKKRPLTPKQFRWVQNLHDRYCCGGRAA